MRFLMLLSLSLWLGAIFFFALLAPTVFAVLPTRELAGQLINPLLYKLHLVGAVCGLLFLGASLTDALRSRGVFKLFSASHLALLGMLILTAISQYAVAPRMAALRRDMGTIDVIPQDDPRRIHFNELHHWSTRLEGGVFVLGLGLLAMTGRRLSNLRS